jgi:hypothetical protein
MSDSILAAIIAAAATLSASILQLRFRLAKEGNGATSGTGRARKSRAPLIILSVVILGAGIAGFALSQWLVENERVTQNVLERELRARIEEMTRTTNQLEQTRAGARAEVELDVLRRLGTDGVAVMATVAPCRPALVVSAPGAASPPGVSAEGATPATPACTEAEASSVTLCATIPANATVSEVQLFAKYSDADTPWSTSRLLPGQESGQARFAEKYVESPDGPGSKQVCQSFAHWSADHSRMARMVVRYNL